MHIVRPDDDNIEAAVRDGYSMIALGLITSFSPLAHSAPWSLHALPQPIALAVEICAAEVLQTTWLASGGAVRCRRISLRYGMESALPARSRYLGFYLSYRTRQ